MARCSKVDLLNVKKSRFDPQGGKSQTPPADTKTH